MNARSVLVAVLVAAIALLALWLVVLTMAFLQPGGGPYSTQQFAESEGAQRTISGLVGLCLVISWVGALYVWALRYKRSESSAATLPFLVLGGLLVGFVYVLAYTWRLYRATPARAQILGNETKASGP